MGQIVKATFHVVVTAFCVIITYSKYLLIRLDNEYVNIRETEPRILSQHSSMPQKNQDPFKFQSHKGKYFILWIKHLSSNNTLY